MDKCVRFMKRHSLLVAVFAAILVALSISWKPANLLVAETAFTADVKTADEGKLTSKGLFESYVSGLYEAVGLSGSHLDTTTFRKALVGYLNMRNANFVTRPVLTIVDFALPSTEKRMWIIDVENKKLLSNNLVAHGQGSGDNFATNFSNTDNSHQSSLGFYVTSSTYYGKHGRSIKLKGMDTGFNTNAERRAIVLHGADYVSESFINGHGRLGRSHGCPAVPVALTASIITMVQGKSCLYINAPVASYTSGFLDENGAVAAFAPVPAI